MNFQEAKRCSKCGESKSSDSFGKYKTSKDGLHYWCKTCVADYQRAYFKTPKGRELQRKAQKEWLNKPGNKEKLKAAQRRYFATEKGKTALRRGMKKLQDAGYFRHGQGKVAILKSLARARKLEVNLTADELENWWKNTPDVCAYCNRSSEDYRSTRDALVAYEGEDRQIDVLRRYFLKSKFSKTNELTIDRADNSAGYALDNLVKACAICNFVKGAFLTHEEMCLVGPRIANELSEALYGPVKQVAEPTILSQTSPPVPRL